MTAKDGQGRAWRLVYASNGRDVRKYARPRDFRGERETIIGGRPPHKAGSTGHVWTAEGSEYYPGVFDLAWKLEGGKA